MIALSTGSQAGEGPDLASRPSHGSGPRVPAARGLRAVLAVVLTALMVLAALMVGLDAAHAEDTADVWCSMSPQSPRAVPGTSVSVTVTCGNHGPDTATTSLMVYTYPAGTTLGPLPAGWGQESDSVVGRTVGSLASGDTVRATFTIKVPASAEVGSALAHEIRMLPGTTDSNSANDSASGQLAVVNKAPAPTSAPTSAAPSRTGAPTTHGPATTGPTPATSAPTSRGTSPGRSATVTAPSTPGSDPAGSVAALPLPSEAAGPPTTGSDASGQGSGLSLLALALIVAGAVLVVGGAVAALLLRRRRVSPVGGSGGADVDRPATNAWHPW